MLPNIDSNINLLKQTNKILIDLPPQIIMMVDTGATAHYFTQSGAHALVGVQPTKMGPELDYPTIAQWTQRK